MNIILVKKECLVGSTTDKLWPLLTTLLTQWLPGKESCITEDRSKTSYNRRRGEVWETEHFVCSGGRGGDRGTMCDCCQHALCQEPFCRSYNNSYSQRIRVLLKLSQRVKFKTLDENGIIDKWILLVAYELSIFLHLIRKYSNHIHASIIFTTWHLIR